MTADSGAFHSAGADCTRTGSAQKSVGVTCVPPDAFGATANPGRSLRPASHLAPVRQRHRSKSEL